MPLRDPAGVFQAAERLLLLLWALSWSPSERGSDFPSYQLQFLEAQLEHKVPICGSGVLLRSGCWSCRGSWIVLY